MVEESGGWWRRDDGVEVIHPAIRRYHFGSSGHANFIVMAPPYERLHAWRECHELALATYQATKVFPVEERYGLTSQARRAAFSAAVNIVEGSARRSRKEFRRFLDIALSSLSEVGYALRFSKEAGILNEEDWPGLSDLQSRARFLTWQLYQALGR